MFKKKSDKLLELFSLKQGEKNFAALSDVSFEVYKGETIGIIGINGSGKSTLSSLLAQVTPPTSGDVTIEGETSLVAISAGLNNHLSGRENIELKCMMHGLVKEEIKEITPDIIEFADIGEFIDQPIKSYSSGMKSRLGFAISAHIQPDILVIDEALSVGDSTFYKKCLDKFDEYKEQGKTIFFISHSLSQVKTISDRILWLNFGRIKMFGDEDEVSKEYNNFIKWFNNLNKNEQKQYRKEMLTSQKDVDHSNDFPTRTRTRATSRQQEKNKNRPIFTQFGLLCTMLVVSIVLLFVDSPIAAINNTPEESQEVAGDDENDHSPFESNESTTIEINENGLVTEREIPIYQEPELENTEIELSFATEVLVEEELNGSIYKISIDGEVEGYTESDYVEIGAKEEISASSFTIEDFLPVLPERISESYAFFFVFLNSDIENVRSKLQGLTDEYTDPLGNTVLEYENGTYSYHFNEENIAEAIEMTELDLDESFRTNILAEAALVSGQENMAYLVGDMYNIVVDFEGSQVVFKLRG
ncbi:ABC transporter ATP-binding protein [Gracilibacillus phocaeensis]|uniref:ABC transporter ATP-binding protein n=1 Tax=Gracilibacillus phocaeensis TaxID=2042304 RepID=UPI002570BC78|nr:ATP-binding cassette domain-containing protein [Gracilibacillus phocaeensis]